MGTPQNASFEGEEEQTPKSENCIAKQAIKQKGELRRAGVAAATPKTPAAVAKLAVSS